MFLFCLVEVRNGTAYKMKISVRIFGKWLLESFDRVTTAKAKRQLEMQRNFTPVRRSLALPKVSGVSSVEPHVWSKEGCMG